MQNKSPAVFNSEECHVKVCPLPGVLCPLACGVNVAPPGCSRVDLLLHSPCMLTLPHTPSLSSNGCLPACSVACMHHPSTHPPRSLLPTPPQPSPNLGTAPAPWYVHACVLSLKKKERKTRKWTQK